MGADAEIIAVVIDVKRWLVGNASDSIVAFAIVSTIQAGAPPPF